jgi:lipopolysaccharide/colanic/teichoic acid biosynthesis glycosyltransferase
VSASRGLPRWVEAPIAAAGLVAASPLIAIGGLAMRATSHGPMFFRQQRVGRDGRPFTMVKLRSMSIASSGPAVTAAGDARITRVGRALRKLKIDELPELWHVAIGEMRLVGPRPEVPALVDMTDPLWVETLQGAPGITDPMTLKLRDEEGLLRSAGSDCERFYRTALQPFKLRGYVAYHRERTWQSDLRVLLQTLAAVLRIPGSTAEAADVLREISGNSYASSKSVS